MNDFRKPAQTEDQHLETLRERGLEMPDEAPARRYLSNISYFRLSAYTRPDYRPDLDEHRLLAGTTFEEILDLYVFDTRYNHGWLLAQLERAGQGREVETFFAHYLPKYTNATRSSQSGWPSHC